MICYYLDFVKNKNMPDTPTPDSQPKSPLTFPSPFGRWKVRPRELSIVRSRIPKTFGIGNGNVNWDSRFLHLALRQYLASDGQTVTRNKNIFVSNSQNISFSQFIIFVNKQNLQHFENLPPRVYGQWQVNCW